MLTKKARLSIFGIIFSQTFEKGDVIHILKDLQRDDQSLAIFAFKAKWEKIIKLLVELGSWVDRFEAQELVEHVMKAYQVNNREIWEAAIFEDPTVYMWDQAALENRRLDSRDEASAEELRQIEIAAYVRAIISAYMIDTKIFQSGEDLKRLDFIFQQEIGLVIKKLWEYLLPISIDEFVKYLKLEFPYLRQSHIQFVLENYTNAFEKRLKEIEESQAILQGKKKPKAAKAALPVKVPPPQIVDEDNLDALFDNIIMEEIPDMVVREPEPVIGADQTVMPKLHAKIHKINTEGVTQLLLALIPKFVLDEIPERTLGQLLILQRHARQTDQIGVFWKILNRVERKLNTEYHQAPESEEKKKLNNIIRILLAFKIKLGTDTARLENLKKELQEK